MKSVLDKIEAIAVTPMNFTIPLVYGGDVFHTFIPAMRLDTTIRFSLLYQMVVENELKICNAKTFNDFLDTNQSPSDVNMYSLQTELENMQIKCKKCNNHLQSVFGNFPQTFGDFYSRLSEMRAAAHNSNGKICWHYSANLMKCDYNSEAYARRINRLNQLVLKLDECQDNEIIFLAYEYFDLETMEFQMHVYFNEDNFKKAEYPKFTVIATALAKKSIQWYAAHRPDDKEGLEFLRDALAQ